MGASSVKFSSNACEDVFRSNACEDVTKYKYNVVILCHYFYHAAFYALQNFCNKDISEAVTDSFVCFLHYKTVIK